MTINAKNTKQNWKFLVTTQIGGIIAFPPLLIGQLLVQQAGGLAASLAILCGNGLLLVLALLTARMSVGVQKSTLENAVEYFGPQGLILFGAAMMVSLLGWFAIQLNVMSSIICELIPFFSAPLPALLLTCALGGGLIAYASRGTAALSALGRYSLPLLVATLAYAIWQSGGEPGDSGQTTPQHGMGAPVLQGGAAAIALVLAAAIAMVVDLPTYFRHAETPGDATKAAVVLFGVVMPAVEGIGAYLAIAQGLGGGGGLGGDSAGRTMLLASDASPMAWRIWVTLFIVTSTSAMNGLNLYSAGVCGELLMPKSSKKTRFFLIGAVATLLAAWGMLDRLTTALDAIGIAVASMGAVVLTCYLLGGRDIAMKRNPLLIAAWACSSAIGYAGVLLYQPIIVSALVDCSLAAALLTFIAVKSVSNSR